MEYSSLEIGNNHADTDPSGLAQGMMHKRIPSIVLNENKLYQVSFIMQFYIVRTSLVEKKIQ